MTTTTRSVAFYLPQFHPIPENDAWWGQGFTEWTNTSRARPKFPGHEQPHVPGELGAYDLRDPEVRAAQAALARASGIDAFCYYHYWFNGRRVLERPFDEVLRSGSPDLPFFLCWANENWTRAWTGGSRQVLLRQRYSADDDLAHVRALSEAFCDPRYVRLDGKPVFLVYRAGELLEPRRTTDIWRNEASRLGVGEIHLARVESFGDEHGDPRLLGFDAAVAFQPDWRSLRTSRTRAALTRAARVLGSSRLEPRCYVHDYADVVAAALAVEPVPYRRFSCVTPGFDNTPRRPRGGVVLRGSTPEAYGAWVRTELATHREDLLFVNAWNEWGEGAHLEPCIRWGRAFLDAHRAAVDRVIGIAS